MSNEENDQQRYLAEQKEWGSKLQGDRGLLSVHTDQAGRKGPPANYPMKDQQSRSFTAALRAASQLHNVLFLLRSGQPEIEPLKKVSRM